MLHLRVVALHSEDSASIQLGNGSRSASTDKSSESSPVCAAEPPRHHRPSALLSSAAIQAAAGWRLGDDGQDGDVPLHGPGGAPAAPRRLHAQRNARAPHSRSRMRARKHRPRASGAPTIRTFSPSLHGPTGIRVRDDQQGRGLAVLEVVIMIRLE